MEEKQFLSCPADLNTAALDDIIQQTLTTVAQSKEQLFDIAQQAYQEYQRVQQQVTEVQQELGMNIQVVEVLEKKDKLSRKQLVQVSRSFNLYSEEDIKGAYENAKDIQSQLLVAKEKEQQLRKKRDQLEISLKQLDELVKKAENLVDKVGLVLKLLTGNLQDLSGKLEGIQQKQQLGIKIIQAQEEERKKLSREIHDGPAQALANIVIRAEVCEKLLTLKPEQVAKELKELKEISRNSLQELRQIIFDLRPMALDDLGIIPTLKRYIADFEEKYLGNVELYCGGLETRLKSSLEVAIFRIVQEALTNVQKHAKATNVIVKLEFAPDTVNLVIRDNGLGFSAEDTTMENKRITKHGYGLISMRERVELLEGSLTIESRLNKGTEIRVVIPKNKG